MRASKVLCELRSGVNIGRLALAQQFSGMEGWQSQQNARFDGYVKEKRRQEYHDGFDQRVERAYHSAAQLHKSEVVNSFKRRLKSGNEKFTAQTTLEMKRAIEQRLHWLRDVWSQVDADYRSDDPQRQQRAAGEIDAALRNEPGDYMKWVYESKREQRFFGPKQQAALDAELSSAELPDVSADEVNRYDALAMDMLQIEREVKQKYGIAGQQHWAELQDAKDALYERKLDRAADIYKELLAQSDRYDESRRTALLRSNVERVHQAQVRFKAAMELETQREKLVEAHTAMERTRQELAKERRVALMKEAAELRAKGTPGEAVVAAMRERQLAAHAQRQAEYQLREQEAIVEKKAKYLDTIEKFVHAVEAREGRALLQQQDGGADLQAQLQPQPQQAPAVNAFGFADADRLDGESSLVSGAADSSSSALAAPGAAGATDAATRRVGTPRPHDVSPHDASKAQLWSAIDADTYEDPFRTIHQARLDAERNYDPLYAKFSPLSTIQGKKYSRQGMGENAAGNAMDNQVLQHPNVNTEALSWGTVDSLSFQMDGDGGTDYFLHTAWHVRDKATGDIDFRYERRKGGAVLRGPRLYKAGAARAARDLGERTMDPSVYDPGTRAAAGSVVRGGGGGSSNSSASRPPRRVVRLNRMSSSPEGAAPWRSE